jgi:hypothetical protein
MSKYADLVIGLHRHDAVSYSIEFRFVQPESDADIRLGQGEQILTQIDMEELQQVSHDPIAYGKVLTNFLFADPAARSAFDQARTSAQTLDAPIRLRLLVGASAPELHSLRWETLQDPLDNSPLTTSENILFSRYLSSLDWRPVKLRPRGKLRALVLIASPSDLADYKLAPIDVETEFERAKNGLGDIPMMGIRGVENDKTATMELDKINLGAGPVYSLAMAADGDTLAIGLCSDPIALDEDCENNIIQLWSASSKTLFDTLESETGRITSLAFSPKESLLVSGTEDQKIAFWVQGAGNRFELNTQLQFSSGLGFSSLAFDSSGSLLAAGNNIGEVLMFDVETTSQYGDRFIGASGPVTALAFSPDSQVLASGSQTGNVILWDLNIENWVDRACELAGRNLTGDEWEKYFDLDYNVTCDQWPDGRE